jgi:hypothetical protein
MRANDVLKLCSYCVAKDGDTTVKAILHTFVFDSAKLAESEGQLKEIIREVVTDEFIQGSGGGGMSFLSLCMDRAGVQWAEHGTMEMLLALGIGLKLAGFCLPRELWGALPGGMPYVWFKDVQGEHE